ncbi:MAG: hypothetical protein AB2556_21270 [Candidatus Thiodiazotropha sp.]
MTRLEPVRHEELSTLELAGDPLADSGSGQPIMDTAFERLYRLRDAREVLWSGASVAMRTERIDTDKAVDVLVRALPLDRLPRVHIPSIASGMELLLDIGQPMQPFAEDQQDLIRLAGEALGKPLVVKYFYDDPAKGVGSGRRRRGWQPYPLPPPGTPVIVISDMGCGYPRRQPATSGWLRLAWRLRQRACRLVVLSPTPADRVPVTLRRLTELVFWDRKSGRRAAACLRRVLDV